MRTFVRCVRVCVCVCMCVCVRSLILLHPFHQHRTSTLAKTAGSEGVEKVAALLNDYFGTASDIIIAYGGDILHYAGDAVIAVYPATNDKLTKVTLRAIAASLELQKTCE